MSASSPLHNKPSKSEHLSKQEIVSSAEPVPPYTKILFAIIVCVVLGAATYCVIEFAFNNDKNNDNNGNYKVWCVGNCETDVSTRTEPGTTFIGGGVS